MRSIMLSVLFAVAPAPPMPPPEFGANGILTANDLKDVTFRSRVRLTAEQLKERTLHRGERPDDYDVAVHLPRTRFEQGEPIPAYFVVKNMTNAKIGLKMGIDFTGSAPYLHGEATFSLRRVNDDTPLKSSYLHATHCSGDSLADLSPNGFFVRRGDLSRLGEESLPPGQYEVEWSCQLRASAPVTFTVLKSTVPANRAKIEPVRNRFLAIVPDNPEAGDDDRLVWKDFSLESIDSDRMSAALAVGPFGKYVPDPRTIPTSDDLIEVRASLRREGTVETLIVTLDSKDPRRPVHFDEVPRLYLQFEERAEREFKKGAERSLRDELKRAEQIKTPLTIEVPFDTEQWKDANLANAGRIAVIVTSGKLTFPVSGRQQAVLRIKSVSRLPPDPAKVWIGLVRSPFITLNGK